jgi:hypothetical protein
MALAGNIKEFGLADIFQIVSLQQKTGILTIQSSEGTVTVLLESGLIVGADATFRPIEERVEQSLVQSEQISKFQLKRAKEKQKKTSQLLWTALAEGGDVDLGVLQKVLSQQIHETVYNVLRWTEGEYRFDPQRHVEYDRQLISPVNTEFLVMEGFRITDEWSELEKEIPSLQVVIRRNSQVSAPPADLSDAELKVYNLLTTERTVQDVIDMSQLGEFDTCQTIYELMRKNLVEKLRKKGRGPKTRRVSFNFTDVFQKVALLAVGIAILVGSIFLLNVLPENFVPVHKPNFRAIGHIKQFTSQSQLHNISQAISFYFLNYEKPPTSFDELVEKGLIKSKKVLTDPWGHEYLMTTKKNVVILRGVGKDGSPETDDDVSIEIPF